MGHVSMPHLASFLQIIPACVPNILQRKGIRAVVIVYSDKQGTTPQTHLLEPLPPR